MQNYGFFLPLRPFLIYHQQIAIYVSLIEIFVYNIFLSVSSSRSQPQQ